MAIPHHLKRQKMNAISHRETQAHMRALGCKAKPKVPVSVPNPAPPGLTSQNVKRMAMNAITSLETVAQVGVIRLAGGVAVYAAHIRQVDREAQRDAALRNFDKAQNGRGHDDRRE